MLLAPNRESLINRSADVDLKGTTMESRCHELLSDFNQYRSRTFHMQQVRAAGPCRDVGEKKGFPLLQAMDEWCRSQGIDSRRWLYYLFRKRKWLFAPKIDQLIPSKKNMAKALAGYAAMTDTPGYAATIYREAEAVRRVAGGISHRRVGGKSFGQQLFGRDKLIELGGKQPLSFSEQVVEPTPRIDTLRTAPLIHGLQRGKAFFLAYVSARSRGSHLLHMKRA